MIVFETVDAVTQVIRDPFMNAARQAESLPILFAFLLGIVGALAPCQISGNVSAMTLYGTKSMKDKISWSDTLWYLMGKVTAFSMLGLIVFLLGQEFQRQLPIFFEPMRQLLGPVLIFVGLYMLGILQLTFRFRTMPSIFRGKKTGPFLLGFSFSLGFCPTMFLLFFLLLMPAAVQSTGGVFLPALFAVGTALPFLLMMGIIWFLDLGGSAVRKSRKIGEAVQKAAGAFMILYGILDIMTFWTI